MATHSYVDEEPGGLQSRGSEELDTSWLLNNN